MQTYNPVTHPIAATQYTGDNAVEVVGVWLGRELNPEDFGSSSVDVLQDVLKEMKVELGDYVAVDRKGNIEFLKKAVFEQFYVPAGDVILS